MKKIFLDSSCWFEYLNGSEVGKRINDLLNDESNVFYFTTVHLAEIISRVKRNNQSVDVCFDAICSHSNLVPITALLAKESGLTHSKMRKNIPNFGLADAIAMCVADEIGAMIYTTDSHFKGLRRTIILS